MPVKLGTTEPSTPTVRAMPSAACGVFDCETCAHRQASLCGGCHAGNEALQSSDLDTCSIWECVQSKGVPSCRQCRSTVCRVSRDVAPVCPLAQRFGDASHDAVADRLAEMLSLGAAEVLPPPQEFAVPDSAIARLRWYLAALERMRHGGKRDTSSWELGRALQIKPSLVRKDLSYFGEFGSPAGYSIAQLREQIQRILGLDQPQNTAWIGARRLGRSPDMLEQFAAAGCPVIVVFDTDPRLLGMYTEGLQVMDLSSFDRVAHNLAIRAAVVAVDDERAQPVTDRVVAAGVGAILNLTWTPLSAPADIYVRNANLAVDLSILSYRSRTRAQASGPGDAG